MVVFFYWWIRKLEKEVQMARWRRVLEVRVRKILILGILNLCRSKTFGRFV
jgi:hypothetical protein